MIARAVTELDEIADDARALALRCAGLARAIHSQGPGLTFLLLQCAARAHEIDDQIQRASHALMEQAPTVPLR